MSRTSIILCSLAGVLLASSNARAEMIFSDDFESGNLNKWTLSGASLLNIDTSQNAVPGGGQCSARVDNTGNRIQHSLATALTAPFRLTSWIYDSTGAREYADVRTGTTQLLAIGKHNAAGLNGEAYDATKYQGRIIYPGTSGYFNLNLPGSPNRSTGWHKFEIELTADGTTANYYVDGILSRSMTGLPAMSFSTVVIGSVGSGTTGNVAYFDGVEVSTVPEPASLLLLAACVAIGWAWRLTRGREQS